MSGDHVRRAYDVLAPAYDLLTSGHDHAAWAARLEALAQEAGLTGRRLLDVGCGTGSGMAAMRDRGYDVSGVDVSAGMLAQARTRLGPRARLQQADMRALARVGEFDLVWSVADAVNCLDDQAELIAAFTGFARNLAPGGVVVFDVDTLASFRALYRSLVVVPSPETVVIFDGQAGEELGAGDAAEALVERLEPAEHPFWRRVRAVHRQRHHSSDTLERTLRAAGLETVAIWGVDADGTAERPLDDLRHNKAVYIAQAAAPDRERR